MYSLMSGVVQLHGVHLPRLVGCKLLGDGGSSIDGTIDLLMSRLPSVYAITMSYSSSKSAFVLYFFNGHLYIHMTLRLQLFTRTKFSDFCYMLI